MKLSVLMRTAVAAGLLIGATALRPALAEAANRPAPVRPNIVVIMADDQDDQRSLEAMPQLRKLAAKGLVFSNSFADFSLCCPSRASFLTGQAAHNSTILGNKLPNGGWEKFKTGNPPVVPGEESNIGVWLQTAGYRTAYMGKLLNGYAESGDGLHVMPGWTEWDVISDAKGPYRYFGYTLNENGVKVRYGQGPYDYQTDVIAEKGEKFIRASDQPFFMVLASIAPHGTHGDEVEDGIKGFPDAPKRYSGVYDTLRFHHSNNFNETDISDKPEVFRVQASPKDLGAITNSFRRRREAMLAVDDTIKRVIETLTETGQLENTYIIVTSDNGYSQGSHQYQGKIVLYEESIRIPLIISGPGVPKGEVRDQLVNNLDVVASIMQWTGASSPDRVLDGHPLSSIITDASAPWRTALLVQNNHERGVRTKDWFYGVSDSQYGVEKEIYSFRDDPTENHNGIDNPDPAYQTAVAGLDTTLAGLRSCAGDTCFVTAAQPGPTAPVARSR